MHRRCRRKSGQILWAGAASKGGPKKCASTEEFIHSAHRPAASCSRAAHFGLGSPGRPPPRAHVRCWRGVPSDRGPLKACAEAGKRGSALLHAWRFEQNHVPPSCGRSFRPTVYGHSHGTRRHGVSVHGLLPPPSQGCCLLRRRHGVWVHGLLPLPPPQGCCLRRRR